LNKDKAIVPISVFGPIIKFAVIKQCDTLVEIHENYQKRSMRNRIQILGANGKLNLSIPLEKGKNLKGIKDVKISYDEDWSRNHIMTIKSAYGNAPYFEYYFDKIEKILTNKHTFLYDLYKESFAFCSKVVNVSELESTQGYNSFNTEVIDLRSSKINLTYKIPEYEQVFEDKFGYVSNLSILDAIFNLGPETSLILNNTKIELSHNDH